MSDAPGSDDRLDDVDAAGDVDLDDADSDADAEEVPGRKRMHPIIRVALGSVVGIAAIWLIASIAGGIGDALDAVARMRAGWVALAVALAAVRLVLYALQLLWLGRRTGPLSLLTALGLSSVVYGFGAITPAAPAEGLAIGSRELRRRGRTKRQARLTVGFSEWFAQRTFYAVAALDLLLVVLLGHLSLTDSWPFMIVAVIVIVAIVGTAVAARRPAAADWIMRVLAAIRIRRPQPAAEARRHSSAAWHAEAMSVVGPPRNRVRLALISAAAVLADAATLWATCHAAGFHIHPELALLARTVGTVASWIPLLPSGLGVVEVAIPAILHRFGAPLDDALAATLVYRAAGTLLPAVAGGLALVALRRHRDDTTPTIAVAGV